MAQPKTIVTARLPNASWSRSGRPPPTASACSPKTACVRLPPPIEPLPAQGLHSLLGVKAGEHASLCQQGQVAEHTGHGTSYERHDRAAGGVPRLRFVNDVPLKASQAAVRVHGIEDWEMGADTVQHFRWVTDWRGSRRTVVCLMRGGRAQWKMANEPCNTLKNQGYNFEHNDGPGEQHLSVVVAALILLAFLVDQPHQLCCALFRAVWTRLGRKRLLGERLRAWCYDYCLDSMRAWCEALWYGVEKPRPLLTIDTSSLPLLSLTVYGPRRRSPIVRDSVCPTDEQSCISPRHGVHFSHDSMPIRPTWKVKSLPERSVVIKGRG